MPDGSSFLRTVISNNVGTSIIFASDGQFIILGGASNCQFDTTFKVCPRLFYQLLVIFANVSVNGQSSRVPCCFVFMTGKTEEQYQQVFRAINNLLPQFDPSGAMCDFETGLRSAFQEVYPLARLSGCWFHFSQNIIKKIRKLGLMRAYVANEDSIMEAVLMIISLPILPAAYIPIGLTFIEENSSERLLPLHRYIRRYWINQIGPSHISVYGFFERSNNVLESFNAVMLREMGANPNLFNMVHYLQRKAERATHDHARLQNGLRNVRSSRRQLLKDVQIREALRLFDEGSLTVEGFLERAKHLVGRHVNFSFEDPDPLADEVIY